MKTNQIHSIRYVRFYCSLSQGSWPLVRVQWERDSFSNLVSSIQDEVCRQSDNFDSPYHAKSFASLKKFNPDAIAIRLCWFGQDYKDFCTLLLVLLDFKDFNPSFK